MHRAHLGRRVAVRVRPPPRARPHHLRAGLLVAEVERRALHRLVVAPGEQAELDRRPRRPRGRRADRRLVGAGLARQQADRRRGGRASPGTAPSSPSCSASRARSSRSPRRPRASRPSSVTSSQMQTKHLLAAARRSSRRAPGRCLTAPAADADRPRRPAGSVARDEDAAPRRRTRRARPPARAASRRAGGRPRRRAGRSRCARPSSVDRRERAAPPVSRRAASAVCADDGARPRRRPARAAALVERSSASAATTTARVPGLERPVVDEPANGARQHHADEVVAREDERLLDRARRDDDPPGADAVEHVARVDRHEPALVDRERTRRREHLVAGASWLARRSSTSSTLALGGRRGAPPRGRSGRRRSRARRRAGARCRSGVRSVAPPTRPSPASVAQELLVQRPERAAAGSSCGSRSRPA